MSFCYDMNVPLDVNIILVWILISILNVSYIPGQSGEAIYDTGSSCYISRHMNAKV